MVPLQKLEVIEIVKIELLSLYFPRFHIYIILFVQLPVPQECYVFMSQAL